MGDRLRWINRRCILLREPSPQGVGDAWLRAERHCGDPARIGCVPQEHGIRIATIPLRAASPSERMVQPTRVLELFSCLRHAPAMPADPAAPAPPLQPDWLDAATLRAMELARDRALAWGKGAREAAEAAHAVAWAHHPALPMTMLADAVALVVPDPEGLTAAAPACPGDWLPAAPEEVAEALAYALRFGSDGKARRLGGVELVTLAATQLVEHLTRCRMVVMRRPRPKLHGGTFG